MANAASNKNGQVCAACQGPGKLACAGCFLVVYCGRTCQVAHRNEHKKSCNSPLIKSTWKPNWILEGRTPAFVGGSGPSIQNMDNEGLNYDQDLDILFAASGDLRNIVKSVGSLPDEYTRTTHLYVNDIDFDVVARNLIITLMSLTVDDRSQAVACMLHVWYSSLIRKSDASLLAAKILPLIEEVNLKIEGKAPGAMLGKTWIFGKNSCRAELTKEKWRELLSYLRGVQGLPSEKAIRIRSSVTLAPHREDYRHRWMASQQPAHRVCASRFFEEGILLPFGAPRDAFVLPNPTFSGTAEWLMMDSANPLQGWSSAEVLGTDAGPATGDLYGKLFHHISGHLSNFHNRISHHGTDFNFLNVDAKLLKHQTLLKGRSFARIEVSNISDRFYLGIRQTLSSLGVILKPLEANPHATLITLFMNAIAEIVNQKKEWSKASIETGRQELILAQKFIKPVQGTTDLSMAILQWQEALCHFRDFDTHFERYMAIEEFKCLEEDSTSLLTGGLYMKEKHTIVEKWPFRLKLAHVNPGAQLEFDFLKASGVIGHERYVEWRRGS